MKINLPHHSECGIQITFKPSKLFITAIYKTAKEYKYDFIYKFKKWNIFLFRLHINLSIKSVLFAYILNLRNSLRLKIHQTLCISYFTLFLAK